MCCQLSFAAHELLVYRSMCLTVHYKCDYITLELFRVAKSSDVHDDDNSDDDDDAGDDQLILRLPQRHCAV